MSEHNKRVALLRPGLLFFLRLGCKTLMSNGKQYSQTVSTDYKTKVYKEHFFKDADLMLLAEQIVLYKQRWQILFDSKQVCNWAALHSSQGVSRNIFTNAHSTVD